MIGKFRIWAWILAAQLTVSACAMDSNQTPRYFRGHSGGGIQYTGTDDLMKTDNPRIRRFREYYLRTVTVESALQNSRPHMRAIVPEFRRRQLPPPLVYLPMLESRFETRADSGHARGLWQFTPQTAEHMGLKVNRWGDERLNVKQSTRAAAAYLKDLGQRFGGNWELALAAYNGGPGYIEQEVRRQGTSNFWDLKLRDETADYVPRFIAMLQVAQEKYPHMLAVDL